METSSRITVPILTEQTFPRWKNQLRNVLKADGLLGYADGTTARPVDAGELATWKKMDAKARAIISSSLDDLHESFVRGCSTSKQMLAKLKDMYERSSASKKYVAWQELFDLKWPDEMQAASFIASVNIMSMTLETLDKKPDDSLLIGKVLSVLPARFEGFKQSWILTKTGAGITFEDLRSGLMNAEASFAAKSKDESQDGLAFLNRGKGRRQQEKGKSKKDFKCHHCQQKGHFKRQCPQLLAGGKEEKDRADKSGSGFSAGKMWARDTQWLGDSGAYQHLTGNRSWFSSFEPAREKVQIGDGTLLLAEGKGQVDIEVFDGKSWTRSCLHDVRFVPAMGNINLFSLGAATTRGHVAQLAGDSIKLTKAGKVMAVGEKRNNVYHMAMRTITNGAMTAASKESLDLWHERLCHIGEQTIRTLVRKQLATGISIQEKDKLSFCEGCVFGRMTRKPYKLAKRKDCEPGEIIHSDLCGPLPVESISKARYILVLKDEASRFRRVFFLQAKDKALDYFKEFLNEVRAEFKCQQLIHMTTHDGGSREGVKS